MDFSSINWLAVFICVVVSMIVGSLWFGPKTFFPIWWKAIGKTEGGPSSTMSMGVTWGLIVLSSFVQAVAMMAFVVNVMGTAMGGVSLGTGAMTGFMLWLGFVAPASLTNKLFADRLLAWTLEAGNHLLNFVLFGAILGAMG